MAKKPTGSRNKVTPPQRVKLSAEESLKRVKAFSQRKEEFVAAVRKGKDRGLSA